MTMLSQTAISLSYDLGLHKDIGISRQSKRGDHATQNPPAHQGRTMEQRRTVLALFHLSSS